MQFIQKLISTYSNDKLLRSKFSSPQRVSIFPVSHCEFYGHVLARVSRIQEGSNGVRVCTDFGVRRQVCDPFGADSC